MPPNIKPDIITTCNSLLIHREFEKCIYTCNDCLAELKNHREYPRVEIFQESLCMVAIQALAELNRWQEVVPYIAQIYGGIEDCPEKIVQACILLHFQVQDYSTCGVLANIWLRNPVNLSQDQARYMLVLDTYLYQVLLPLSKWEEMHSLITSCAEELGSSLAETYKQQIKELKERAELERIETLASESVLRETGKKETETDQLRPIQKSNQSFIVRAFHYWRKLTYCLVEWVKSHIPFPVAQLKYLQRLALITVIGYLLLTRNNTELLSWETLGSLWSGTQKLWRAMFSPFYMARSSTVSS